MRRVTAVLVILTLTAGVISALVRAQEESKADSATAAPVEPERPKVVPRAGQTIVTGLVDTLEAEAQGDPLVPPFTISAVERGLANLTIENAVVAGARVAINWNGGTPLPVSGAGGLDLGGAHVETEGAIVTWTLDGAPRGFLPGAYRLTAPVGIGPGGIATPRESVDFQADAQTVLVSRGGTVVRLTPRQVKLEGPGTVVVTGQLRARTPEGERTVRRVELRDAPFAITLDPAGRQLRIDAVLQGPVVAS